MVINCLRAWGFRQGTGLVLALLLVSQVGTAQHLLGNDFGLMSHDVRDQLVSTNRYEGTTFNALNLGYYVLTNRSVFTVRYTQQFLNLQVASGSSEFSFDYDHYALLLAYQRKVGQLGESISFYLGGAYLGHFSNYRQKYLTAYNRFGYLMSGINLAIAPALRYQRAKSTYTVAGRLSLFQVGARPDLTYAAVGNEIPFANYSALIGNYIDFNLTLSAWWPLGKRITLKPEYMLWYNRFTETEVVQLLRQSWTLGIYYTW